MAGELITPSTSLRDPGTMFLWSAGRALEFWAGMKIAGQKDRVVKRALVGSASVQLAIYLWSKVDGNLEKPLPSIKAINETNIPGMILTYLVRSGVVYAGLRVAGFKENAWRDALAGCAVTEASVIAMNL